MTVDEMLSNGTEKMEKAVAVRAFVKIDDFVFSVAVHRPIILRLFQNVNAKKIQ